MNDFLLKDTGWYRHYYKVGTYLGGKLLETSQQLNYERWVGSIRFLIIRSSYTDGRYRFECLIYLRPSAGYSIEKKIFLTRGGAINFCNREIREIKHYYTYNTINKVPDGKPMKKVLNE
jgi:hypothetical protein